MHPALAGAIAGLLHVFSGPDHLVAVAPLALRKPALAFRVGTLWGLGHASGVLLLGGIVAVAGVFSALFVNDTMCLVLTPLVIEITRRLGRNPIPYLLAVAMASNIGSVATLTGNPQNMMIGGFSGIPYRAFAGALAPVAAVGLALTVAVIALVYRREFTGRAVWRIEHRPARVHRFLLAKSVLASAASMARFTPCRTSWFRFETLSMIASLPAGVLDISLSRDLMLSRTFSFLLS